MVENQLVLQEFKKAGYQIPESYFQGRIEEEIRRYGDRLTLTKTLQAEGITYETWRNRIRGIESRLSPVRHLRRAPFRDITGWCMWTRKI